MSFYVTSILWRWVKYSTGYYKWKKISEFMYITLQCDIIENRNKTENYILFDLWFPYLLQILYASHSAIIRY